MSERWRATQLACRNPSIRLAPLPTVSGSTLQPFPQIRELWSWPGAASHSYGGAHGYEDRVDGFDITLDGLADEEMKFYDALEFFNRPASPQFIAGQIARLRVSMPRRAEENTDIEMLVDVMVEDCRNYPADVIGHVTQAWRLENRYFPMPKEFRIKLDQAMGFRKAVWSCFQEKRNPLLAKKAETKQIAADPRLGVHWRDLPKENWMRQHFAWAIGECENMLKLAEANSASMDPEFWKAKTAVLRAEMENVA
jgi:hypothetical protein